MNNILYISKKLCELEYKLRLVERNSDEEYDLLVIRGYLIDELKREMGN